MKNPERLVSKAGELVRVTAVEKVAAKTKKPGQSTSTRASS